MNSRALVLTILTLSLAACGKGGSDPAPGGSGDAGGGQTKTPKAPAPACLITQSTGSVTNATLSDPFTFLASFNAPRSANPPAAGTDPSPVSDATRVGNLYFDGGLSKKERGAFVAAMDYLGQLGGMRPSAELLKMMKIAAFDRASIQKWVEDRVQYIIPETAELDEKFEILQQNYTGFDNPGILPPQIKSDNANAEQGKVVMSNIGAALYLGGKARKILIGVKADGLGHFPMSSPRSGVLRVGEGLFMVPAAEAEPVKIFHLTTLIHEARHSDGNKMTTGFLHEDCPEGHDYAGQAACDHNRNGPYEIEALATKALMESCASCTTRGKEIVKILYLDVANRMIDDSCTKTWDDAPEGHR